jgi:4-hydroxy-2-oxoheptanedioate aldolase
METRGGMIRRNLLRERLATSIPLMGAYLSFPYPAVVEFCGLAGFDWVFIDAEHSSIGVETCASLVRAADAVGVASVVRVPTNEPSVILPYAETGVNGLIVPHVKSVEDAENLVQAVRYWPRGSRGFSSTSRAANYGITATPAEYLGAVDRQTVPIALIEDQDALPVLDDIAAVADLDVFVIGPGDLSMSMGLPGGAADPRVQDRIGDATAKLLRHGKTVGTTVSSPDSAKHAVSMGMRMLVASVGSLLSTASRQFLEDVRS